MRSKEELKITANRRVYKRRYKEVVSREAGLCTFCGWHRGENAPRKAVHGHQKLNKTRRGKP